MYEVKVKKMVDEFLQDREELKQKIYKALKKGRKRREKMPKPIVTNLVDRENPWETPSYHDQMQELARKDYEGM